MEHWLKALQKSMDRYTGCHEISEILWKTVLNTIHSINQSILINSKVNPLPDHRILTLSKLKEFAGNKLNVTQNTSFVFHRVKNIVGKGEIVGYQHFLFSTCFQMMLSQGTSKVIIVRKRLELQ